MSGRFRLVAVSGNRLRLIYHRRVKAWPIPVLVLVGVSFLAAQARAQVAPEVDCELQSCSGLSVPAVRRILAAELGAELADAPGPGVTTAVVVCHDHDAELRVQDPLSPKIVTRHINVGAAAPNARARLIAIATSELVLASWSELETNPHRQVEPAWSAATGRGARSCARPGNRAGRAAGPFYREALEKPPPRRPFRLLAVISQRAFFSHPGALWAAALRLGRRTHAPRLLVARRSD